MAYIYGLRCECGCPYEGIRYVGQTVLKLGTRLVNHRSQSRFGTKTAVYNWMRKHGEENIRIELIEEVPDELLDAREIYWISKYRDGPGALNISPGGGPETAFRGVKRPDISALMRGSNHPASVLTEEQVKDIRAKYRGVRGEITALAKEYGVSVSSMSDLIRGVSWGHTPGAHKPQGKKRIRLTEEDVRAIRGRRAVGETLKEIAKDYSTSEALISSICLRKSWKHVQ